MDHVQNLSPWKVLAPRDEADSCNGEAVDDTRQGLRIGAIFIILVASLIGSVTPVFIANQGKVHVPKAAFFVCKYVGTGVIIATAWLHLLDPAIENLSDECLAPRLGDYPWALAIALWTVLTMFFVELMAARKVNDSDFDHDHSHGLGDSGESTPKSELGLNRARGNVRGLINDSDTSAVGDAEKGNGQQPAAPRSSIPGPEDDVSYPPGGQDHLAHRHEHTEGDSHLTLTSQLLSIFILEFGIMFHSVFIGLTLGTTDELVILLIVLVFHQMFEGLGLGSRLAVNPWPRTKGWVPYVLALAFSISTPVGVAAGMGARPKNLNDQKLVNGIFDAISAGILMYTGLVELLAHEFMFNPHMRKATLKVQLFAFGCVLVGMGVMATLANWA